MHKSLSFVETVKDSNRHHFEKIKIIFCDIEYLNLFCTPIRWM